jgi:hypothetical protein
VVIINKKKLSLTFNKIKLDINNINESIKLLSSQNKSKIKTINQKFNLSLDETIILFKKRLDLSINEINDSLQDIYDTTSKSKLVDKKFAQIQHVLDKHSINIKDFNKIIKKNDKNLILLNSKLQEFENISVDIEDVESNFISRSEVNNKILKLGNIKKLENSVKKLIINNEKLEQKISNLEDDSSTYASITKLNSLNEKIIDLKSNIIIKKDLEQMNNRIDKIEDKFYNKTDSFLDHFKKLELSVEKVLKLKKEFVSKEQFKNLRKEIKMIVQGLKDVQKIKSKISRINSKNTINKNIKSRNINSSKPKRFMNFFFEE